MYRTKSMKMFTLERRTTLGAKNVNAGQRKFTFS